MKQQKTLTRLFSGFLAFVLVLSMIPGYAHAASTTVNAGEVSFENAQRYGKSTNIMSTLLDEYGRPYQSHYIGHASSKSGRRDGSPDEPHTFVTTSEWRGLQSRGASKWTRGHMIGNHFASHASNDSKNIVPQTNHSNTSAMLSPFEQELQNWHSGDRWIEYIVTANYIDPSHKIPGSVTLRMRGLDNNGNAIRIPFSSSNKYGAGTVTYDSNNFATVTIDNVQPGYIVNYVDGTLTSGTQNIIPVEQYARPFDLYPEIEGGGGTDPVTPVEPVDPSKVYTIEEVLNGGQGQVFTTQGTVISTVNSWGGNGFYIQDETAGTYVYPGSSDTSMNNLQIGDVVQLTGTLGEYRGAKQLINISSSTVTSKAEAPAPTVLDLSAIANAKTETLVRINNVEISGLSSVDNYGTAEFTAIDENGNQVKVRHDNRTGTDFTALSAKYSDGDKVDVIGILTTFDGAYQIKPFSLDNHYLEAGSEPVDPEDPVVPVDPEDPVDPVDPEDPVEPVDPEDPVDPVDPEDPVDPVTPGETTIELASGQLETGTYILVGRDTSQSPTRLDGTWIRTQEGTEDNLTTLNKWTLNVNGDKTTITDDAGTPIGYVANANQLSTEENLTWTVIENADGSYTFASEDLDRNLALNIAQQGIRQYRQATLSTGGYENAFMLYKVVESVDPVDPEEPIESDVTPIAEVRTSAQGQAYTIQGTVISPVNVWGGQGFYVQDATGGIYVRPGDALEVKEGDIVKLTANLAAYAEELQMDTITSHEVVGTADVPAATLSTISELPNASRHTLVRLENVTIKGLSQVNDFGTAQFTAVDEAGNEVVVRHDNRSGSTYTDFTAKYAEGDVINVEGILTSHYGTMQILPFSLENHYELAGETPVDPTDPEQPVVEVKEESKIEAIPYTTIRRADDTMLEGEERVLQAGVNGEVTIIERVTLEDGVEVSRVELSRNISKATINEIIVYGTKTDEPTEPKPGFDPEDLEIDPIGGGEVIGEEEKPEEPEVLNGWQVIDGNVRYYVEGTPLKGMTKANTETIYLFDSEGNRQYGWHVIDGKALYFNEENGGLLTGLRTIGQTTYLLTTEGKMTGWHNLNGKHYYFSPEHGGMLTGRVKVGQTTYLLTSEGKQYGWHRLNGLDYYFSPEFGGGMVTGIRTVGQTRYEFHSPEGHKLRIVK